MMGEDIKIKVCRLCFNLISDNNFFYITRSLKDMLGVITTDLNLDITDFPVMCTECLNLVQDIFNFKTNFFESEEMIEANIFNPNIKLDLSDIMNNSLDRCKYELAKIRSKRKKLCRTCLKEVKGESYILNDTDVCLSSMLESCLSELDLMLTSNPVMCKICYKILQKMSIFKTMCKENESKIELFLKTADLQNHKNVNLHSVLQFSFNLDSNPNDNNRIYVKKESKHEYHDYSIQDCLNYVMVKIESTDDDNGEFQQRIKKEKSSSSKMKNEVEVKVNKNCRMQRRSRKQISRNRTKKCEKKTTRCSDCNFKTKYKYNLRRHLIVAHRRDDVEFTKKFHQCPQCNFATRWNLDLTRHMLSHVKPEAFQCTRCPYSTNQNSHLVKHILSHVNADNVNKYRFLQPTKKKSDVN